MSLTRRQLLTTAAATATSAAISSAADTPQSTPSAPPFRFCLNTSTIRGQKLTLPQEIRLAGKVGYTGIEPWIREIDQYVRDGGSLKDLRKRITDAGLRVESAIGFAQWIVDDD
ncbi:MAG TPA: xylose isomerase, partial [Planctomycetaceae bacterium]|nr:xylose isomerase [Planctomycetaceae bacterium]